MTTEPDRLEALKPCPLCQGEAEYTWNQLYSDNTMATCRSCGCTAFYKKWNTRLETSDAARCPLQGCVLLQPHTHDPADRSKITLNTPIETNSRTGDTGEGFGPEGIDEAPDKYATEPLVTDLYAGEYPRDITVAEAHDALVKIHEKTAAAALSAPQSITPPEVGGGWLPIPEKPEPMVHFHVWHKLWDGVRVGYYDAKVKWWLLRDMKTAEWSGAGVFPSHYRRITSETLGHNLPNPPEVGGELERVAKAISDANWKDDADPDFLDKQFNDELLHPLFIKQARVAIAALSTPKVVDGTAGLVEAAFRAGFGEGMSYEAAGEFPVSCADVPDEDEAWKIYKESL